ncbi:MAG: methyltransferase domain-containing protein [Chitinophagales bacterium]|nr:methyltransferase domain-containing protein [Chitinophagales bacterium]
MNFKFFFPTFRTRYRFVRTRLRKLSKEQPFERGLNLGTGEGDYDRMIAGFCQELIGCDVNEPDLEHARALNKGVMNLRYELNNALELTYPDNHFDLVVSSEVIEHVGQPEKMVQEIYRVLRPGGYAVITFPSQEFPITYDPVNRIWQLFSGDGQREYAISQGAYAFGHEYLIPGEPFKRWAENAGFEIVEFKGLSRHLTGLAEMYWTGIAQSIFKKNAGNLTEESKGALKVRPASTKESSLVTLTDAWIDIDEAIFSWSNRSVGKGVVLRKQG